jgi:hypothetical protein
MRILFWLEPHLELLRPGVMKTWLGWFEHIADSLRKASSSVDYRILCLDSPAAGSRAHTLGERLILLSQAELLAQWRVENNAFIELEHDRVPVDVCTQLVTTLYDKIGDFEPDFIFLLNQQSWLRRGFPSALFVNIELNWTSRPPFPLSWQLDIVGGGKGRVLAECYDRALESLTSDVEVAQFVDPVRATARERLASEAAKRFIESLRKSYSKVTLFPVAAFDHSDGRTPFFAVLDKFLGEQRGDNALILTQHPMWQLLSAEQLAYLIQKYPFLKDGEAFGGQHLLPWSDFVVGDFSTLATQALFFDCQVVSIRQELKNCPVNTLQLNPLVDILSSIESRQQRDRLLYWLLKHYTVPEAKIFDGTWLLSFLRRALGAVQNGQPWTAYQESVATKEDWAEAKWRLLLESSAPVCEARLYVSEIIHRVPRSYSQDRSVSVDYPLSDQRHSLKISMPHDLEVVHSIRLDLANMPLSIRLYALSLINADGSVLWSWRSGLDIFKNSKGLVFLEQNEGLICICLSDDPQFDLEIPAHVLEKINNSTCLEIELNVQPDLETMASILSSTLSRRDQTIAEQSKRLIGIRGELLRAEAQMDLLKEVMLSDCEEEWLSAAKGTAQISDRL